MEFIFAEISAALQGNTRKNKAAIVKQTTFLGEISNVIIFPATIF
jgi:hypothetical protein